jgi:hypothetical protein
MKTLHHMLALSSAALVAAAPMPAAAQEKAFPIEKFAEVLRKDAPVDFGAGVRLVWAEVQSGIVVLTMELTGEEAQSTSSETIAEEFAAGFCQQEDAPQFFEAGLRMRVDAKKEGEVAPGVVIDRCPS